MLIDNSSRNRCQDLISQSLKPDQLAKSILFRTDSTRFKENKFFKAGGDGQHTFDQFRFFTTQADSPPAHDSGDIRIPASGETGVAFKRTWDPAP